MHRSVRAFLSCVLALVIAATGFVHSAAASSLTFGSHTTVAFVSPATIKKTGKVVLRVAPKVADKLVKKYGAKIIKVIPAAGTAITVIEIGVDTYNLIQDELSHLDEQQA